MSKLVDSVTTQESCFGVVVVVVCVFVFVLGLVVLVGPNLLKNLVKISFVVIVVDDDDVDVVVILSQNPAGAVVVPVGRRLGG